jgi:hypothetical protein
MSEDRLQTLAYEERNVGKPGRCVKEKVLAVAGHAIHVFVDFVSIRITLLKLGKQSSLEGALYEESGKRQFC